MFGDKPFDSVSTDEIAERAGISKGLLYHYFPSKRSFYVATLEEVARRLRAASAPDPDLGLADAARASLDGFLDFVEENASLYRALMRGGVGSDPEVDAIVEEIRGLELRRVLDAVGITEPEPHLRAALQGWCGFAENVVLDWLEHRDFSREALVGVLVRVLAPLAELLTEGHGEPVRL